MFEYPLDEKKWKYTGRLSNKWVWNEAKPELARHYCLKLMRILF